MIWIALGSVVVAALIAITFLPVDALRSAHRRAQRADGTTSPTRAAIEANHSRRAIRDGLIVPVGVMAAVGVAIVAVHVLTPWSRAAMMFGTNTAETATVSENLTDSVRDAPPAGRSDEGLLPAPSLQSTPSVGTPMDTGEERSIATFLLTHWPLHPIFLALLGLGLWRVYRRAARQHHAYMDGVRTRQRQYQRRDLQLADAPDEEGAQA